MAVVAGSVDVEVVGPWESGVGEGNVVFFLVGVGVGDGGVICWGGAFGGLGFGAVGDGAEGFEEEGRGGLGLGGRRLEAFLEVAWGREIG